MCQVGQKDKCGVLFFYHSIVCVHPLISKLLFKIIKVNNNNNNTKKKY
jgi:hypothetical protein